MKLITFVAVTEFFPRSSSGVGKVALAGIVLGTIAGSITLTAFMAFLIFRRRAHKHNLSSKRLLCEYQKFLFLLI